MYEGRKGKSNLGLRFRDYESLNPPGYAADLVYLMSQETFSKVISPSTSIGCYTDPLSIVVSSYKSFLHRNLGNCLTL